MHNVLNLCLDVNLSCVIECRYSQCWMVRKPITYGWLTFFILICSYPTVQPDLLVSTHATKVLLCYNFFSKPYFGTDVSIYILRVWGARSKIPWELYRCVDTHIYQSAPIIFCCFKISKTGTVKKLLGTENNLLHLIMHVP